MDAKNQQLAIPYEFNKYINKHFSVDFELFGSAINRYHTHYCSLFYDVEKFFGSHGSFFNINPIKGVYIANPPFDEEIMHKCSQHLIRCLSETEDPLCFMLTIPVWDYETLTKKFNLKDVKDYGEYRALTVLTESKYFYKKYTFLKNNFPYYNYSNQKLIRASNTYFIIIKNNKIKIDLKVLEKGFKENKMFFRRD
jgi:hypothetical protein